jgi:hypothetical protein
MLDRTVAPKDKRKPEQQVTLGAEPTRELKTGALAGPQREKTSAEGKTAWEARVFPQPVKSCRKCSKCDIKPDEPGIFENPWNDKPIQTSGRACARFWIQIAIGDWKLPIVTDSLDILDTRLVAAATRSAPAE